MFNNRKERMELLQGLITSNMDAKIPTFQQVQKITFVKSNNPHLLIFCSPTL
jgi:hypothetical protein